MTFDIDEFTDYVDDKYGWIGVLSVVTVIVFLVIVCAFGMLYAVIYTKVMIILLFVAYLLLGLYGIYIIYTYFRYHD